ncbi:MAG TPA: prepilin-type N-terminal cleavage/methylation domain-containing protein [Longimicrobium sp.]|nr:prepilin-type N-terminal cleavage/methylation domain-containing protein [Longimicrobium sp.]
MPSRNDGFTLVEVVVALALAGLLLLGARVLLEQVGDAAERISGTAAEVDREANGERLLRAVVGSAEQPSGARAFRGDARGARFTSWCDLAAGWQERCDVSLGVIRVGERNVLAMELPRGEVVALRHGFASGRVIYLRDAADGGSWLAEWASSVSLPLAVGVVLDGDTLILRVGERG